MGTVIERFFPSPLQDALVNDTVSVSNRQKEISRSPPPCIFQIADSPELGPRIEDHPSAGHPAVISVMGSGTLVMQKGWERPPALMLMTRSLTLHPVRTQARASWMPAATQEAAASLSPASFAGWSCRAMAWRVSFTIWSSPLRDCAHIVKEHT